MDCCFLWTTVYTSVERNSADIGGDSGSTETRCRRVSSYGNTQWQYRSSRISMNVSKMTDDAYEHNHCYGKHVQRSRSTTGSLTEDNKSLARTCRR